MSAVSWSWNVSPRSTENVDWIRPMLTRTQRTRTRKGVVANLPIADADGGARPIFVSRRGRGGPMSVGAVGPGQDSHFGKRAGSLVRLIDVSCLSPYIRNANPAPYPCRSLPHYNARIYCLAPRRPRQRPPHLRHRPRRPKPLPPPLGPLRRHRARPQAPPPHL